MSELSEDAVSVAAVDAVVDEAVTAGEPCRLLFPLW